MTRQIRIIYFCLFLLVITQNLQAQISSANQQQSDSLYNYYPRAAQLNPGDTLFVIEMGAMNSGETLLISTLAGVVAQNKPSIYIPLGNGYLEWQEELETHYGLVLNYQYRTAPWKLLSRFKNELAESGYILCDLEQSSVNVATSLAGIWRVVAVDAGIENRAQAAGLQLKMDVRGKDESWCFQNYGQEFNPGLLIQQKENLLSLRDYGPLAKAFTFYDGNSAFMSQIFNAANDDSPVIGWGDASQGEDKFVKVASEASVFTVPSDHAWNLSVFSGLRVDSLFQRTHVNEVQSTDSVHTVTFIMSDGDNIQWLMNDFSTDEKWYGSPVRGQFNMGWTISPSMAVLAPTILDRLYRDAATGPGRDYFVSGVSGGGYLYPSYNPALAKHCDRLDAYLKAADLNIVTILEHHRGYFTSEILDNYTRQAQVIGCFYMDYAKYDYYAGKIVWSNNKPVVSAKFNLWEPFDSPEFIAESINGLSTDPTDPAAYSFINVHPWSRSLADVQRTFSLFRENVEVVTPEEFIKRMVMNVAHEPSQVDEKQLPNSHKKIQIDVYPNPVGGNQIKSTNIKIHLNSVQVSKSLQVRIVNILGRTIREWRDPDFNGRGGPDLLWDTNDQHGHPVSSGIYFAQVFMNSLVQSRKILVLR